MLHFGPSDCDYDSVSTVKKKKSKKECGVLIIVTLFYISYIHHFSKKTFALCKYVFIKRDLKINIYPVHLLEIELKSVIQSNIVIAQKNMLKPAECAAKTGICCSVIRSVRFSLRGQKLPVSYVS